MKNKILEIIGGGLIGLGMAAAYILGTLYEWNTLPYLF